MAIIRKIQDIRNTKRDYCFKCYWLDVCLIIRYDPDHVRRSDFRYGDFSGATFVSFIIPPTMEFAVPDGYVWCDVAFLNNVYISLFIDICFTHSCISWVVYIHSFVQWIHILVYYFVVGTCNVAATCTKLRSISS